MGAYAREGGFHNLCHIPFSNVNYIKGTGTFGRVKLVKIKNFYQNNYYALKMMKKTEIVKLK